ncbi:MAG: hypothetical protein DHS20C17_21090 [Cyclobacteriaceae bacterium]|nr:MAG: hypothetical protein DHS20C17_21090 [Cyclobacteriaceae bacterium]
MKHEYFTAGLGKTVLVMVILVVIWSFRQGQRDVEPNNLKIITYNLWNGFEWGKDSERRKELVNWVKIQNPDVVALQELCDYTREKLLEDATEWGHTHAEILKTSGYPVGITSKEPIEVKERILEGMHHGALHCKTSGIDFMVVHFSPFSYEKRRQEAKIVLTRLSRIVETQNRYVVLGDFNAVSPFDADLYKDNGDRIKAMQASERENDHVRNLFQGQLEYGVMGAFLSFPLLDVVQKYTVGLHQRISAPTQVFEENRGEGRHPNSKRIDYILVSPAMELACTNARVLNTEETFYLSDHYPVLAEFDF